MRWATGIHYHAWPWKLVLVITSHWNRFVRESLLEACTSLGVGSFVVLIGRETDILPQSVDILGDKANKRNNLNQTFESSILSFPNLLKWR